MKKVIPAIVTSLLLLSGCSSLLMSNAPAPNIYALRAASDVVAIDSEKKLSHIIEIQRPILPPGFDTARMAMYLENGRRLDYYSGAQWAAPLDEAMREFTTQTVRKTLSNVIVSGPGQSAGVEYRLQMRVNDFQPVYALGPNQPPRLYASITFTLFKMPEETILTNFTIEQQEAVQQNSLGFIASGLEHMLQSVEAQALQTVSSHIK